MAGAKDTKPEEQKAPETETPEGTEVEAVVEESEQYVVTGAAVVLPIEGGSERYLYRGALISTGYTEEGIKHALSVGLIEKQK
jgi:hypothetical protein